MLGATSPDRVTTFFTTLSPIFWTYLVVQGYPVSHGDIGSASTQDPGMVSGIPAIAALSGIFVHIVGFCGSCRTSICCWRP